MIKALIQKGELVEAIKLYREEAGAGLKEVKAFVESLQEECKEALCRA